MKSCFFVSGSGVFVAGDAADAGLGDAAAVAAGIAYACACSVAADADGVALGLVAGVVLEVGGGELVALEGVFVLLGGVVCAGDDASGQAGVACDVDLEAVVACFEAALFFDVAVVALDVACSCAKAAADGHVADADGEAASVVVVLALVGAGVLQAFYVELTLAAGADVGDDAVCCANGSF
ncbi:hypothetical protein ACO0LB_19690 [Undibacterium sp. SXout7W]|uniref:hypothetical protein n=1 Tax=Undibacterium sp. SXout7W TaxID=3413049 RepID=UPI003BF01A94